MYDECNGYVRAGAYGGVLKATEEARVKSRAGPMRGVSGVAAMPDKNPGSIGRMDGEQSVMPCLSSMSLMY